MNNALTACLTTLFPAVAALYDAATLEKLTMAYQEPQRDYHGASHIVDLLQKLDYYRAHADRPDLIGHAILWHDAVYRTFEKTGDGKIAHRSDALNVDDSTKLFLSSSVALSAEDKACVAAMIRATDGHNPRLETHHPQYNDTALFLDLDLSVLALPFDDFTRNTERIRFEYPHIPARDFCIGRAQFMEVYGAKAQLFFHPVTAAAYDAPARDNMKRQALALRQKAASL